jgi:cob(I)alamin adenosyltransferase
MVTLSKIYTKIGDGGMTHIGDSSLVRKDDLRIESIGDVDELNSMIGLVRHSVVDESDLEGGLSMVQNDLFDLGADLCRPLEENEQQKKYLRIRKHNIEKLEKLIDSHNSHLKPLNSFVLPGGTIQASYLHVARSVCRRAERRVWALARREKINDNIAVYLNRLADLFFVLARYMNKKGEIDVLWQPGLSTKEEENC